MKNHKINFGQKIRFFRKKRGLSQEMLAGKSGLHRTYIGDIEVGGRNISLINIHKLAVALGVKPKDLF